MIANKKVCVYNIFINLCAILLIILSINYLFSLFLYSINIYKFNLPNVAKVSDSYISPPCTDFKLFETINPNVVINKFFFI